MQAWQEFISQQPVAGGDSFPRAAKLPSQALCALPHLALIRVSGGDMVEFLQGQLINDTRLVTGSRAQLSGYCSPKGRLLTNLLILQRDADFYLQLPADRAEATLKRLGMFVLRADVRLEMATDLACVGVFGDQSADLLPLAPPADDWGTLTGDSYTIVRHAGTTDRFQVIAPIAEARSFWTEASESAVVASPDAWPLLDIRAGLPSVQEQTVEAFVPQMTNLQLLGGVSFKKGCYTGQEVVARMQYLGKLKRRMYRVRFDAQTRPEPGMALFAASSSSEQGAGRLVDISASPDGGYEALAVIEIASAEGGKLHLGNENGPAVELLDLPYALELPG